MVASTGVKKDIYVDNLLTGADMFQEAEYLRDDLLKPRKGGFCLQK